jgi:hypothetical protein
MSRRKIDEIWGGFSQIDMGIPGQRAFGVELG